MRSMKMAEIEQKNQSWWKKALLQVNLQQKGINIRVVEVYGINDPVVDSNKSQKKLLNTLVFLY